MKLNWFLRSVLMNEAGDGGAGGGGGGDSTALTVSTGTAVATQDGTAGDGTEGTADGALATTAASDSEPIFDTTGRMTQSTSKVFKELETSNPKARTILGRAQRALGTFGKLTSMLGAKPFDEINRLRKFEKDAGGEQGLTALRASVEDMEKSDELYGKADPQLIAMMTESPAGKHAFVKLFPHTVAKLSELAPQTYTRWIGMQILHSLEKSEVAIKRGENDSVSELIDIPFRLRRMYGLIPTTQDANGKVTIGGTLSPEAAQALSWDMSFIYAFVDQIRGFANATPEDLTPPKEDTSAARIAQAEKTAEDALQDAWKIQRDSICNDLLSDEVRKQTKGMDLSATIIADITAKARASINATRTAQPDNKAKIGAFFTAKNLNGYLAYNKRIVADNAEDAVERAVQLYGRKSSRRAPATQAGTTETAATSTGTGATGTSAASTTQTAGKVVRLTADQASQLGGKQGTRWMKQRIGNGPGTTGDMVRLGQQMLRKGNPLNLAEGTIVQFP